MGYSLAMRTGIRLGKIWNIEVFVDFSWVVILIVVFVTLSMLYFPQVLENKSRVIYFVLGLTTTVLFFISSLIHELAHSLVSIKNKVKVEHISLFLFGGISNLFEEPPSAEKEFKIAISGPVASLGLALILAALWVLSNKYFPSPVFVAVVSTLFQINLILAMFNLLPGFPLDGGKIMRSIIWATSGDYKKATQLTTYCGQALGVLIIAIGVFQILLGQFWFGVLIIMIGFFIYQAAGQNFMELKIKELLRNVPVLNLMNTQILTLSPNLSIDSALSEYFLKYMSQSFPVIKDDQVVGLISLSNIRKHANSLNEDARVQDCMESFPHNISVAENTESLRALKIMIEKNLSFLPVKREGRIIGMITLEEIANYLAESNMI